MLTVAKISSGAASTYAEYLEGKTTASELGDYYLKDGERVEAPGRWVGGGRAMGCDPAGPVSGETLRELMAVRRPDTGEPLRRAGAGGTTVAAIDATFSAPKSVSAIWALADPALRERIECAHELAIDRALAYALGYVAMVRERVDDVATHRRAAEVIATSWRHTTARAVDGQAPDPQLHSHVLLHAAIRRDGEVVAIDSRSWFVHRREVGAAYRTELAREMTALGYQIRRGTGRGGRYFEIASVPQQLLDRWSSRHHQVRRAIEARLARRRATRLSAREDRYLTTATRAAKTDVHTRADLDRHWRQTARRIRRSDTADRAHSQKESVRIASDGELRARLTEFDARFADRDARAVALEASAGLPIETALAQLERLQRAGEVLALADHTRTTREHRNRERHTVARGARLAGACLPALPPHLVHDAMRALDDRLRADGGQLSAEQRAAVDLGCGQRQLVLIEGHAGTGKSTTLAAIARAHQADGREIIVTSTAGLAAERLADELRAHDIAAPAFSLTGLQAAIRTGGVELDATSTVIHDEAALASTREQDQLFDAVERFGARLIEVGDPRQSRPVGAGGLWPSLGRAAEENDARVELTGNVRAHDPADRRDQHHFRRGEIEHALRGYHDRGRITAEPTQRRSEDAALDAAHTDRGSGRTTLVIAQTSNEHLDELNARAQAIRRQTGELGEQGMEVPGRPYRLHSGDQIQVRKTIPHPDLGQIRNGTLGRVSGVDARGLELRLGDGRLATLDHEQIVAADLRLAYVQHPFPAQGHTTDTTHLIVAEHPTREGTYVALTRARERTHLYTSEELIERHQERSDLSALAEHLDRTEPDIPSIDIPLAHENTIETETETQLEHNTLRPAPRAEIELEPGDLGFEM